VSAPREKVLVIRLGSLGDVVLASAVLEALARERPAPEVHLVTKSRFAPLFEGDARVARIIPHAGRIVPLLREIRRECYGRALDLHANPRSRLIALCAHADDKRAVDNRRRERRALLGGGARPSERLAGGVVAWYGEVVGAPLPPPRLAVEPGAGEAAAILAARGVAPGYLAVAPGARHATKAWPRRHVAAFLRAARGAEAARAAGVLLVGSEAESAMMAALSEETGTPWAAPPLAALPSLLARAAAVVANDSAPLHVAEAVGTPAVALFGPTVAGFGFAPRDPRSVLLEIDLDCRPCTLHGGDACPLGHHRCMEEIAPERVLAAALALLGASGASPPAPLPPRPATAADRPPAERVAPLGTRRGGL
jgi:heptosyltransferase-2